MFTRRWSLARQIPSSVHRISFARTIHAFHPLIRDFVGTLKTQQPCFPVAPRQIQFLSRPNDFYKMLLSMIRRAERRIFFSSLYIGSEELELIEALREALRRSPKLEVVLQLDLNRSTRPGKSSTAHLLLPLLREFPDRIQVSLFRSPKLRGLMAKLVPPRFNEGWGTWHAKIYGADDEVMISGANLNKSYFTDRQDRYLHFTSQPDLAEYCSSFLRVVSSFSFKLLPFHPSNTKRYSYQHKDYSLTWSDSDTHPHHIHEKAEAAFRSFHESYTTSESIDSAERFRRTSSDKVLLFPLIQAGQFNIREEEASLSKLFRHLLLAGSPRCSHKRPLVDLTSGYFGLYQPYRDLMLSGVGFDCRIIAASPKANGFYGSLGISGRIPEGYTYLEQQFIEKVCKAGRLWNSGDAHAMHSTTLTEPGNATENVGIKGGIMLSEWQKDGWTYHAKGIWVSPSLADPPLLTLFGSTNLNSRSAHLDTELSFIMAIPSEPSECADQDNSLPAEANAVEGRPDDSSCAVLRQQVGKEITRLREDARPWEGASRRVRLSTKAIVKLVGGML